MALKSLFDNYMEFEEIIKSECDGKIDLYDVKLNPTVLLLLDVYAKNNKKHLLNEDKSCLYMKLPEYKFLQQDIGFIENIMKRLDVNYAGNFVLRHILSELTYNIHEHAFENNCKTDGAIAIKFYDDCEKLDISIIDDGLSIPGRFEKSNVDFHDDCNAIEKAINNFSTVSENPYEGVMVFGLQ